MRLIDADAFDRALASHEFSAALNEAADKDGPFEDMPMYYSAQSFRDTMRCRPTIDAVPMVHGRWIEYPLCLGYVGAYSDDHIVCSNCKSVWSIIDNDAERFDYCPHCGAKMDGERRDGEDGSA